MPPLVVILGPTATGKSEVAIHLALRIDGWVIGADSAQVYRGLEAGTCKPPEGERRGIPHSLIDVAEPEERFSAGRFARMAADAIDQARRLGRAPIVVGGTGLYLRALLEGIVPVPPRDDRIRSRLLERAASDSVEALHDELAAQDPETASRVGRRDLQRIVRALEVRELTGVPLSRHIRREGFTPGRIPALKIGLTMDRKALYSRIDARVDRIFASGIVQEAGALLASGLPAEAHAFKALGYREVLAHLRGDLDLARTIDLVKRNTRRYARRQIIWFRREPDVHWIDVGGTGAPEAAELAERLWRLAGPDPRAAPADSGGDSG